MVDCCYSVCCDLLVALSVFGCFDVVLCVMGLIVLFFFFNFCFSFLIVMISFILCLVVCYCCGFTVGLFDLVVDCLLWFVVLVLLFAVLCVYLTGCLWVIVWI